MPEVKENEFKCDLCGEVFEKAWSDEEKAKEYELNKTGDKDFDDNPGTVCSDCFRAMREMYPWLKDSTEDENA